MEEAVLRADGRARALQQKTAAAALQLQMRQSPRTVASDPEKMADDVQEALTKALATGTPARVFRRGVASAAACAALLDEASMCTV